MKLLKQKLFAKRHHKLKNAANRLEKQKGLTLIGILMAGAISSFLALGATAAYQGVMGKAQVSGEAGNISEFKNGLTAVIEERGGFPIALDAEWDKIAQSRFERLPNVLNYQFVLLSDNLNKYNVVAIKAFAKDAGGAELLTEIAAKLDVKIDGADQGTAGQFLYSTTCSAPATPKTSVTDCYYITPLISRSDVPADIAGFTTVEGTPVAMDSDTTTDSGALSNLNF